MAAAGVAEHCAEQVALAFADAALEEAVAEEVEAHFIRGAIGDVARVLLGSITLRHLRLNAADFHAENFVERAHPIGVALGEVVVDGGEVGTLALERGKVERQRGGERFAFAGLHFDDRVVMDGGAAEELHVEVPHVESTPASFAHECEGLDEQAIERLTAASAVAKREASFFEIEVGLCFERFFEGGDLGNRAAPIAACASRRRRLRVPKVDLKYRLTRAFIEEGSNPLKSTS